MTSMPDAVKHYDGTKSKFIGMVASLLVFLGAADFILTSAPSHFATLSDTLKAESDSSALEFTQYFGPMNLRIAHNDIINILLSIFLKFVHTKEFFIPKLSANTVNSLSPTHGTISAQHILSLLISSATPQWSF